MSIRKIAAIVVLIAVVFLAGMWASKFLGGSSKDNVYTPKASEVRRTDNGNGELTIDKETQNQSGIVTEKLSAFSSKAKVKAFGQVLDAQSLIELTNSYATAEADVQKSSARLGVSRKEYNRVKTLFEYNKNVSEKDLQSAEANYISDKADNRAATANLFGLKGEIRQQWGSVITNWISSSSGMISEIVNHKMLILQITVPPEISESEPPQIADVQTPSGKIIEANFVSRSPKTDSRVQGISYFYRIPANGDLSSGMNVVAYLPEGKKVEGVVIPDSAVVWWNGNAWVYLSRRRSGSFGKEDKNKFVRREISTTNHLRDGWFVTYGVKPGDKVVINGAQLLLSQEFKSQIQASDD